MPDTLTIVSQEPVESSDLSIVSTEPISKPKKKEEKQSFENLHPTLAKAGYKAAGAFSKFMQTPLGETVGGKSLSQMAEGILPPPASGGIKGEAADVVRGAAGLADFIQTPTGLAALGAELLSGGTVTPILSALFGAQTGAQTIEAGKAYIAKPTPENLQNFLMGGGMTALMGAGAGKTTPPAKRKLAEARVKAEVKPPEKPAVEPPTEKPVAPSAKKTPTAAPQPATQPVTVADVQKKLDALPDAEYEKAADYAISKAEGATEQTPEAILADLANNGDEEAARLVGVTPKAQPEKPLEIVKTEPIGAEIAPQEPPDAVPTPGQPTSSEAKAPSTAPIPGVSGKEGTAPAPGEIGRMKVSNIEVDAPRFQFKLGVGKEGVSSLLKGVKKFREELGGVISVWTDPENGKTYVINGHHRLELAKRTGKEDLYVRSIVAKDAAEARAIGALQNIAEGRGTALDAAKFFREGGLTPESLREQGISLGEATAEHGVALSKLDPFIFDLVVNGEISQNRGIAIGAATDNPAEQEAILKMVERAEDRGRKVTDDVVAELARFVKGAGQKTEDVQTLFGTETRISNLALEKAEVSAYIKKKIRTEKRLFGAVSGESRAAELGKAGNVIKAEENARIAQQAAQAEDLYEKLSGYAGPVSQILDSASERIANGENPNAVKEEAYGKIRAELPKALSGTVETPAAAGEAAPSGQRAGQHPGESGTTLFFGGLDPRAMRDATKSLAEFLKGEGPENLKLSTVEKGVIREKTGELARKKEQLYQQLEPLIKEWDKKSGAESLGFIDKMERGFSQDTQPENILAAKLRDLLDDRRREVQALGNGKLTNFIQNYFPHIWERPGHAQEVFQRILGSKKPLQGPASFLKQRTLPLTSDGIAAGLTPVTFNPVKLSLLKLHEMDRYIMAHQILNEMKESGLAKFVKMGSEPPEGYTTLDDRMFNVLSFDPESKAFIVRGKYWAPRGAAEVVNRYVSPGISGNLAYDIVRQYGNTLNQMQLGFSLFHLGFTSIDSGSSDVALAVQRISRGEVGRAVGPLVRAGTLTSPIFNAIRGNKLFKEYMEPGRYAEMSELADALAKSGGRVKLDPYYKNSSVEKLRTSAKAWKESIDRQAYGKTAKESVKIPFRAMSAVAEIASKPVMEWIVPRQKLGVFAGMAEDALRRLGPLASAEERRYELDKVWDSVDNRMGQLVYDNLFWNKTTKDLAMLSVRSLGWNIGTLRELGGGVADIGKQAARMISGRRPEVTSRMAYIAGMTAYTAYVGAVTTYLATGHGPSQLIDYFFPPNGGVKPNGEPSRDALPSYVRDVYGWRNAPLRTAENKVAPWLQETAEMLNNKDFYGTEIRHPDDPIVAQAADLAKFWGLQFESFSFRNYQQAQKQLESKSGPFKSFFGLTPAASYIGASPLETYLSERGAASIPAGARTKAEFERSEARRNYRNMLQQKRITPSEVGKLLPQKEAIAVIKEAHADPIIREVRALKTIEEAMKAYELADEQNKKKIRPYILRKYATQLAHRGPAERTAIKSRMQELGLLSPQSSPASETPALQLE